jgi:hypothetical protein
MTPEIVRAISKTVAKQEIAGLSVEVETTDATPTVIFTIPTESYERGIIEYTVNAVKDDGDTGLTARRLLIYKNDGTTLTITTGTDIITDNDFTSADITESVSGTDVIIEVTGEATTNIKWEGSYEHKYLIGEVAGL